MSDTDEFIKAYRAEYEKSLKGENATEYNFKEFCKNTIFIEYAKDHQSPIIAFLDSYKEQFSPAFLKELKAMLPNKHIKSFNDYTQSIIHYTEKDDFTSSIFSRRFPAGTISYIGARTGRGKTTALVNLAIDALNQSKKVVFVTAEETTKQIITRVILSLAYQKNPAEAKTIDKPRTALFTYIKNRANALIDPAGFFCEAYNEAESLINNKRLVIFEAYGASWDELKNYLAIQPAGTVILIDYIQHLKTPEAYISQTRQIQIQEISHQLADIAGLESLVTIAGAQFNRTAKGNAGKADPKSVDTFDETSFREAGDIEQDGHILIGIGKDPNTATLFFTCMKDREASPDNTKHWKLEANLAFSYLTSKKDQVGNPIEFRETETSERPGKEKDDTNGIANFSYKN